MSDGMDDLDDLDRFRLVPQPEGRCKTQSVEKPSRAMPSQIKGEFLKGAIPLGWLGLAAKLPGKAHLAVALAVWLQARRRRAREVTLTTAVMMRFGIDRKAKYRGLMAQEGADLVRVQRVPRRNPIVTIIEAPQKAVHQEWNDT